MNYRCDTAYFDETTHEVIPTNDLTLAMRNRWFKRTEVNGLIVSTVFLGIDPGFSEDQHLWFETMIFENKKNGQFFEYQQRYETYDEAIEGHQAVVDYLDFLKKEDDAIINDLLFGSGPSNPIGCFQEDNKGKIK